MRDTAYVDVESTSLIDPHLPGGLRVWEVAIIRLSADRLRAYTAWVQITDVELLHADPDSLAIGRFADRFSDAPGPRGAWGRLGNTQKAVELHGDTERHVAGVLKALTHDAVIAGSNPRFDMAALADLLRRHGQEPSWYHHPRDIPNLAHGWLLGWAAGGDGTGPQWTGSSYSTGDLSEACGVEVPKNRHAAWADTEWMYRWDEELIGGSPRPDVTARGIL